MDTLFTTQRVTLKDADVSQIAGTVILGYTCPPGRSAIILSNTAVRTTGATATLDRQLVPVGGVATNIGTPSADNDLQHTQIALIPGDTFRLVVKVAGAPGDKDDLVISILESNRFSP